MKRFTILCPETYHDFPDVSADQWPVLNSAPLRTKLPELLMKFCLLLIVALIWAGCCMSEKTPVVAAKPERTSKIAPELLALYDQYSSHLNSGSREPFRSTDPLVQVVNSHVIVDAVASGGATVLQTDLIELGMRDSVAFGRIVSGQLPISSIPDLAKMPSLNFARAASAMTQKNQPPMSPR
jgi:hypothetical protein